MAAKSKRDSSTNLPGSTNRRPGSPVLCPGASRKGKNAGHSARNDSRGAQACSAGGGAAPSMFAAHDVSCPYNRKGESQLFASVNPLDAFISVVNPHIEPVMDGSFVSGSIVKTG